MTLLEYTTIKWVCVSIGSFCCYDWKCKQQNTKKQMFFYEAFFQTLVVIEKTNNDDGVVE